MKILLAAINARFTHSNLALRYLRNYAERYSDAVFFKEFTINQNIDEILAELNNANPDVICFSAYIWNSVLIQKILPVIGAILPSCKIVLGGPEVSYNASNWISRFPSIDYIIASGGEASFELLLKNKFNYPDQIISIPNYSYDFIPFPYKNLEFPNLNMKYIYYESSRGCPFKCSYCLSSRIDQSLDYRSLEKVKEELTWLISKKPRIIKFVDRTFNSNGKRAREIWTFLMKKHPATKFHFEIHPSLLTTADFELLAKAPADLFQFEIGIQSTNSNTIKEIGRFEDWQRIKNNIESLLKIKQIHSHSDMIVGLPFEDMKSTIQSFNNIYNLKADHFQVGFLKILPGTGMAEKAVDYQIVVHNFPPYEILQNRWLSFKEIRIFKDVEHVVELIDNSGKFSIFMENILLRFESPFHFFSKISSFFKEIHSAKWKKSAAALLEFTELNFPEDLNFFRDCLKWDFCLTSKVKFFPKILDDFLPYKDLFHRLIEPNENIDLSYQQFKKGLIFMPATKLFRKKYLSDNKLVVFTTLQTVYV